jgi:hypothetical protein
MRHLPHFTSVVDLPLAVSIYVLSVFGTAIWLRRAKPVNNRLSKVTEAQVATRILVVILSILWSGSGPSLCQHCARLDLLNCRDEFSKQFPILAVLLIPTRPFVFEVRETAFTPLTLSLETLLTQHPSWSNHP